MVVTFIDVSIAALSLIFAMYLRVGNQVTAEMLDGLAFAVPAFTFISVVVFYSIDLNRRFWRYTSLSDLATIIQAATLSICIFLVTLVVLGKFDWMPRSIPVIQWLVLLFLLGGVRMARRLVLEYRRTVTKTETRSTGASAPGGCRRALIVGNCERVQMVLRLLEGSPEAEFEPVGILDSSNGALRLKVRGVPILGTMDALEQVVNLLESQGQRPQCVILTDDADSLRGSAMVRFVTRAESLGLKVACLPRLAELENKGLGVRDLRFINMTELLGRPQATLDPNIVSRAVEGRKILVTGAGGTIGSELVRQIASFQPGEIILLDASEFNLYNIDLELQENHPHLRRTPVLCSIRQRKQVMQVFAEHRPDLVFHAAALKHVPLVEQHPCAGVLTNVIGTRNVADAARTFKAQAMVQVSTDKAVNPVGLMGATKRLGELYCQALDLDGEADESSSRFLTVRFGNVLGSSGSLIPLFQRQLSRGASLTVTHPDIQRYFMTVHEAVQLILQSTARALGGGIQRGRIFVLDMGEPVKIIDIARRMIRLSGLEPDVDVKIDIVGLRPGEKLYEELFDEAEQRLPSVIPGIFEAEPNPIDLPLLNMTFNDLATASAENDVAATKALIQQLLQGSAPPVSGPYVHSRISPAKPGDVASHAA